MASRHLKTTIFFKSTATLSAQNFPNFDFWGAQISFKFPQIFSPLRSVAFACGLASGRGSWGETPLHLAAREGHDSVVKQLLEANPAVDAQSSEGRGLGRGFWGGNLLRHGIVVRMWMKMLIVQVCSPYVSQFMKRCAKILYQHLVFVIALMFPAPVRLQIRQAFPYWRFSLGRILERPMQSKIDHSFSALFNGPWYLDVYLPDSVTCVLLKIRWSQSKGYYITICCTFYEPPHLQALPSVSYASKPQLG